MPSSDACRRRLRGSIGKAAALINWMNSNSLSVLAIHWSKELPTASLDSMPLRAALADAYVIMHDWHALEAMLKRGSWPPSAESLRLALLSKVAFENGDGAGADKYWTDAIKKSESNPGSLESLQHLASQWQWTEKEAKILWLLVEKPATQSSALQALYRLCTRQGDTTGLYRTFLRLAQISPGDRAVENNLVQLSLLLNLNRFDAQERAKKLHEAEPDNIALHLHMPSLFIAGKRCGGDKINAELSRRPTSRSVDRRLLWDPSRRQKG